MNNLTDLETCKRIAEIEGYITKPHEGYECCAFDANDTFISIPYNPLKDDALCFRLMVKYKVDVGFFADCVSGYIGGSCKGESIAESPNKAILLAIIETHKD